MDLGRARYERGGDYARSAVAVSNSARSSLTLRGARPSEPPADWTSRGKKAGQMFGSAVQRGRIRHGTSGTWGRSGGGRFRATDMGGFIRWTQQDGCSRRLEGLWVFGLVVSIGWVRWSVGWWRRGCWRVSGLGWLRVRWVSRCGRRCGFGSRGCWCVGGLSIRRIVCRLRSGSGSWLGSRRGSRTRGSLGRWGGLGRRSAGRSGGRAGGGVSIGRCGPSGGLTGRLAGLRSESSSGARGC
jgi:hypothetical protein